MNTNTLILLAAFVLIVVYGSMNKSKAKNKVTPLKQENNRLDNMQQYLNDWENGAIIPGTQPSIPNPDTLASGTLSSGENPQALFYGD